MAVTLDLGRMTTSEKLRLMENLWHDLSNGENDVPSPDWHGEVLAERTRLISSGEETYLDWEMAKKLLRDELR
ncbi:addiction module protein [Luteolibacter yonseiensis]|uniref:Addiction module protein n=1 Tax=Luteolibacter yonseiensis TaxID=1144680 RepID=A0A934V8F0_9BACT|nr:addiction module protein [Luteolibacter yonseiensis]MBK1817192.1 addiction module protein [Luteolibacter yonseiensis]